MNCLTEGCDKPVFQSDPEMSTLVGYHSPEGHSHDDNCRKRGYTCEAGHQFVLSVINRCSVVDCDWTGKTECFCHSGPKVEKFPDVPTVWAPQWAFLSEDQP